MTKISLVTISPDQTSTTNPVDSILLLSFGGPEKQQDVMPFLKRVTAGRNIPDKRLATVADQYKIFGGVSPINEQNRQLREALEKELNNAGYNLPVYWGNRNWYPLLAETVQQMANDGKKNSLVFATSAYSSYSGCRQYLKDLTKAAEQVGPSAPRLQKLRLFYNHPGFIKPLTQNLQTSLMEAPAGSAIVFTAHSIPLAMAQNCDYQSQLKETARLVMETAGLVTQKYDLVFQSRSGSPQTPWLEPDINTHLATLKEDGYKSVIVFPIGFISDHMEVLYDLDTKAHETANDLGLEFYRVKTVGTSPRFVTMIKELIEEQLLGTYPSAIGEQSPWPAKCPNNHCEWQKS